VSVRILTGDCRTLLRTLAPDSVHCVVTSPPYWGLRDYNIAGQLGLEASLGEHIDTMVDVFREVRRVLRPDGVVWLNYGDCYATSPNGRAAVDTKALGVDDRTFRDKPFSTIGPIRTGVAPRAGKSENLSNTASDGVRRNFAHGYLKPKDLCMIPERLFIALQDDGWWVRAKLPWLKRNGMPESITDRPANSIEQVALLTRSERYWYDADAVRKVSSPNTNARVAKAKIRVPSSWDISTGNGGHGDFNKSGCSTGHYKNRRGISPKSADNATNIRAKDSWHKSTTDVVDDRNFRNTDLFFSSVRECFGLISDADGSPLAIDVNPRGFSDAHFATFPPALVEPLIKAGCPQGGVVLDPFAGAGTTGLVADRLQRDAILIELNPEYSAMAERRIFGETPMFAKVAAE
jgi:DNA modification methylase